MRWTWLVVGEGGLGGDELRWVDEGGGRALKMVGGCRGRVGALVLSTVCWIEVCHGREWREKEEKGCSRRR